MTSPDDLAATVREARDKCVGSLYPRNHEMTVRWEHLFDAALAELLARCKDAERERDEAQDTVTTLCKLAEEGIPDLRERAETAEARQADAVDDFVAEQEARWFAEARVAVLEAALREIAEHHWDDGQAPAWNYRHLRSIARAALGKEQT